MSLAADHPGAPADELWMRKALAIARRAAARGEVPVGAIAVREGQRLSSAANRIETAHDATAHAEMIALRAAASRVGSWRLSDVSMYVTLEPCPMCASAMVLCRLGRLVYAAADPKKGADGSAYRLLDHPANNHRIEVSRGVLADEAADLLSGFFRRLRS
jgi:tRNA(adenine34) deaminase